ncbi:MAG: hypothetical protein LIO74_10050 [Ruminococcus sp.]|nr:hypothetical protein [Ruminococcus sp.]
MLFYQTYWRGYVCFVENVAQRLTKMENSAQMWDGNQTDYASADPDAHAYSYAHTYTHAEAAEKEKALPPRGTADLRCDSSRCVRRRFRV